MAISIKPKLNALLTITILFSSASFSQEGAQAAPAKNSNRNLLIEEVFVTVTKRTESVQKVSAAVSAYTGELLKANNIQDFQSLSDLTPGMTTRSEGSISIRGISNSVSGGASPVAFHVNGMFLNERGEPFYDIESLEVLRGPSGTAFGRNATGGAINVKWRRPESAWGIGGDYREGTLNEKQLRAYVNAPLLGKDDSRLLSRWVFYKRQRDGTVDNVLTPSDADPNTKDEQFWRVTLSSEINEDLLVRLRHVYSFEDNDILDSASMSQSTRDMHYAEQLGGTEQPEDLLQVKSDMRQRFPDFPGHLYKTRRLEGDLNWGLDLPILGNVDLDVLYMDQRGSSYSMIDLDGADVQIVDIRQWQPRVYKKNMEIRLTSQNDGGFNWLAGAFWYHQQSKRTMWVDAITLANASDVQAASPYPSPYDFSQHPELITAFGATDSPAEVDSVFFNERSTNKSKALFGNIKLNLKELLDWADIEVLFGMRANRDSDRLTIERELVQIVRFATDKDAPYLAEPVVLVDKGAITFGEFKATTGELGAKWFYDDFGMLYAKVAKGYKAGKAERVQNVNNQVAPEFLESVELGWKAGFFQRALIINVAAYAYDYTDLQISKVTDNGWYTENAGEAFLTGAELEIQFSPSANLYTQFAVSYNANEFGEFCGKDNELESQDPQPGCPTYKAPHNFKGEGVADAPPWTVAGLIRYSFNLGDWGTLTPQLKMNWVDDYFRRPYGNPIDDIDGYTKTDVRLIWQSPQERYRLEAFVENLEDHDDLFYGHFSLPDPGAYTLVGVQPRRTSGVIFEVNL